VFAFVLHELCVQPFANHILQGLELTQVFDPTATGFADLQGV